MKTNTTASTTSDVLRTSDQEEKYERLLQDALKRGKQLALKKADPDRPGLQNLLENGDEFMDKVVDAVIAATQGLCVSDEFANEEVASTRTYPRTFHGLHQIKEQIVDLAKKLGLDPKDALAYAENVLPGLKLANPREGSVAIMSLAGLEKLVPDQADFGWRFVKGVELLIAKNNEVHPKGMYNWRSGEMDPKHLRMNARIKAAFEKLAETQKGDILIVPAAQLGMLHRGRSVRRARKAQVANEFGLGCIGCLSVTLTHTERLSDSSELDMDTGDDFSPDAGGDFSKSPHVYFNGDEAKFDARDVSDAHDFFGLASGFLP